MGKRTCSVQMLIKYHKEKIAATNEVIVVDVYKSVKLNDCVKVNDISKYSLLILERV